MLSIFTKFLALNSLNICADKINVLLIRSFGYSYVMKSFQQMVNV